MARRRLPPPLKPTDVGGKMGDEGDLAAAAYEVEDDENAEAIIRQLNMEAGIRPEEERGDEKIKLPPPGE